MGEGERKEKENESRHTCASVTPPRILGILTIKLSKLHSQRKKTHETAPAWTVTFTEGQSKMSIDPHVPNTYHKHDTYHKHEEVEM